MAVLAAPISRSSMMKMGWVSALSLRQRAAAVAARPITLEVGFRRYLSHSIVAVAAPRHARIGHALVGGGTHHHGLGCRWVRGFQTESRKVATSLLPDFAFAFDIDGVLLHESKPVPGATEVLKYLEQHNIPFILLTNGGGKLEAERVQDLSEKLGVRLSTDNFVQSHTPFRQWLEGPLSLRDGTVLVTGSDYEKCRAIFKEYGFQNVVTPADIFAADPTIFPFQPVSTFTAPSQPLPRPLFREGLANVPYTHLKIDAIFVLNDPRDWALDTQIITDLLLSHRGYLGTVSWHNGTKNDSEASGWQRDEQPKLYFSNPDLFWSAAHPLPRLGQGAFRGALQGMWHVITNGEARLKYTCIGKPSQVTYEFAERVLRSHREDVLRAVLQESKESSRASGEVEGGEEEKEQEKDDTGVGSLQRVYMVGDNPSSDIAGANRVVGEDRAEWVPVLVSTGVWKEGRGLPLEGNHKPRKVVNDVKAAVDWALRQEGWDLGVKKTEF